MIFRRGDGGDGPGVTCGFDEPVHGGSEDSTAHAAMDDPVYGGGDDNKMLKFEDED